MRDIKNKLGIVASIQPQVQTAGTVNGSSADLRGFDSALIIALIGAIVASGLGVIKVQESDDDSAWNDVAAADLVGAFAVIAQNTPQRVSYIGAKRYVRLVSTYTSGTSYGVSGVIVRGHASAEPIV